MMFARAAAAFAGVLSGLGVCGGAWGESAAELDAIVVTATRVAQSSLDIPMEFPGTMPDGQGPRGLHYVQCGAAELSIIYVHQRR